MTSEKILCIDDEDDILDLIKRYTKDSEFEVDIAVGPEEAKKLISENQYAVIVCDVRMGDVNGIDFICGLEKLVPSTRLINMSSHTDMDMVLKAMHSTKIFDFIQKPLKKENFLTIVNKAFNHYTLLNERETLKKDLELQNIELEKLNNHLDREVQRKTFELNIRDKLLQHLAGCSLEKDPFETISEFCIHLSENACFAVYNYRQNKYSLLHKCGKLSDGVYDSIDKKITEQIEIHTEVKIKEYRELFNLDESLNSLLIYPLEKFHKQIGCFILATPCAIEQKASISIKDLLPLVSLLVYDSMVEKDETTLIDLFSESSLTE
jgi:FixJ family two-component response regulator